VVRVTAVSPGSGPFRFGRAPVRRAGWGGDTTDADYEDPDVVAANLQRSLDAARVRLTGRVAGRFRRR
jgi:hypothetical protein